MAAENENYVFAKMSTVLSFPIDGFKTSDMKRGTNSKIDAIDKQVEKAVKEIVEKLKASHGKFVDADFGPTSEDPHGAKSLYGNDLPTPAGVNKYPAPESIRWDRPQYSDDKFDAEDEGKEEVDEFGDDFGFGGGAEDEVWCMNGELFIDGSSSGDVIQGKLGDCWFLGALAVLGTREDLLAKCFWRLESFKEFGLFVCVFYKDCALRYVIIDDRIPVFANSGKVVFAQCKDPNELWVPLIEKAYAKLHGCYKALIGGYVHFGLADMTGFAPRLVGIQPGHMGYSDAFTDEQIWHMLKRYRKWNCLMGTSIQAKPNSGVKVEAAAPEGLKYGHAYSFLDVGSIRDQNNKEVKLVKLRNPWGFGEWTGKWGDNSPEREANKGAIEAAFQRDGDAETTEIRANDGTFFMAFEDWKRYFTSLFVAINFPSHWEGQLSKGRWSGDVGGPREMTTWMSNPKIKLRLPKTGSSDKRAVFIGLYIHDTRMILGKEYYTDPLYKVGVGFDVVTEEECSKPYKERIKKDSQSVVIPGGCLYIEDGVDTKNEVNQPPYMFGTTQVEAMLSVDTDYYIVPSLRQRKQPGIYFVQVYSDGEFELEHGVALQAESEVESLSVGSKEVQLTKSQFAEKTEELREKLLSEAKKLNISLQDMKRVFRSDEGDLPRTAFKRRLIELGFSLADFPDEDFIVLDKDNNGSISMSEFVEFFEDGIKLETVEKQAVPPTPPVDDLVFAPIDLEGVLNVRVLAAKNVRKASAWFTTDENGSGPKSRSKVRYDPAEAAKAREVFLSSLDMGQMDAAPVAEEKPAVENTQGKSKNTPVTATPGKYSTLPGFEDAVSVASVNAASNAFVKQTTEKVGMDAGVNLHDDTMLQKKEVDRTKFLGLLRARQGNNSAKKVEHPTTLLVNPKAAKKPEPRKLDNDVRAYLGLPPVKQKLDVAEPKPPNLNDIKLDATLTKALNAPAAQPSAASDAKHASAVNLTVDTQPPAEGMHHRPASTSPVAKIGIHQGGMHDFWDMIIDRVSVIAECRSKEALRAAKVIIGNKKRFLPATSVLSLSTPKSVLPTPTPGKAGRLSKGTRISASVRATPGTAAINSAVKAQEKTKATLLDVKDALKKHEVEVGYVEIYRRQVALPVLDCREADKSLAAERLSKSFIFGSNVRSWFEFFDKNQDGEISFEEFFQSLRELNIELSKEDTRTLFLRFETIEQDGLIDWREFMSFYHSNIENENKEDIVTASEPADLVPILNSLVLAVRDMGPQADKPMQEIDPPSTPGGSHPALDIADISATRVSQNTSYFRSLGIPLSEITMGRISRVFDSNISQLSTFLRAEAMHESPFTIVMTKLTEQLLGSLAQRCSAQNGLEFTSEDELQKLWLAMAPSFEATVTLQQLSTYFSNIVVDNTSAKRKSSVISATANNLTTNVFMGHDITVLCNLLAEQVTYSHWNKRDKNESGLRNSISYSAFHAFLKREHVNNIERKLKYLMHLQSVLDIGRVSYLVHAYVPNVNCVTLKSPTPALCDHVLLIAYDPLTSTVFKLKVASDVAGLLPQDHAVVDMIRARYQIPKHLSLTENTLNAARLYNTWETPMEDMAISDLCNRLRLVNTGHDTMLLVSEDKRFLEQLQALLDHADLPFFYVINELLLRFEVSHESVKDAGSMAKLVFGSIRKHPGLCNFMMNVLSEVTVQLRTYDHDMTETMTWVEMIAYLSNNRNPFVTVQLLPQYVEPVEGVKKHLPEFLLKKYGLETPNKMDENALLGEEDDDEGALIYKGKPDVDGGSHPSWEQQFNINFKPPSLTNCKVVITDIAKMFVEDSYKYIIIMVREAKDKSLFMTAYDPRSATEYMLFGSPAQWMIPDIANESPEKEHIFKAAYPEASNTLSRADIFQEQLSQLIDMNDSPRAALEDRLHLGFAITPRLLVSVYNSRNTSDELLGYSQISVSSVLSGTGNLFTKWSTLMYEMTSNSGSKTYGAAGALHVQLGYLKKADIEAGIQSKLERQERVNARLAAKKALLDDPSQPPKTVKKAPLAVNSAVDALEEELEKARLETEALKKEHASVLQAKQAAEKELLASRKQVNESKSTPVSAAGVDSKTIEELQALKVSYEKLQREADALKQQTPVTLPVTMQTNGAMGAMDNDSAGGDSVDSVVHSILNIFIKRYRKREKEDPAANPLHVLRPLVKLSSACSDSRGLLSAEVTNELFSDLLIDVTDDNLQLVWEALGGGKVSVGSFNEYFLTKLCTMLQVEVPVLAPSVPAPIPPQPEPKQPSQPTSVTSQAEPKLSQTAPVKLQQPIPPEMPPPGKINWDTYPLPEGPWERRLVKDGSKVYYLNHETKTTQWHHPLEPVEKRRGRRTRDAMSKTMGAQK